MYKEIIGKNLKYLRKKKNVTQISAEKMTGIDRTTISAYELAKKRAECKQFDIACQLL